MCFSERKQIRCRLGTVEIGEKYENVCDCKGFSKENLYCEKRSEGDEMKKYYACKKGGVCLMYG